MNKEQPNWVTEYNHYSDIQQKKDEAKRIIRKLHKQLKQAKGSNFTTRDKIS